MIEALGLCKVFSRLVSDENEKKKKKAKKAEDFYAVDHVDITAGDGEILGILGPNGAGKTTLLRMLSQMMEPTDGAISITDKDGNIITDKTFIKTRIGYLSGNTKLYHRFSIRELLSVLGDVYGLTKDETSSRIEEICEILNLGDFIDNRIERLSTGQTQRANIARCLIHKPDIYIFDEPTLGLDIISSEAIIEFMKQEKERGKVIIYSTHYMEEAQYLCDRIAFMNKGQIIAKGSPDELMKSTGTNNLRDTFKSLACILKESENNILLVKDEVTNETYND